MGVNCKIQRNNAGGYHVFMNGVDVAPFITSFNLKLELGRLPCAVVEIPIHAFECAEDCDVMVNKIIGKEEK